MSANLKIISDLRNFITLSSENSYLKKAFLTSPKAFTRKRKLHFELVVCILLNFFKKSYAVEISEFFSQIGMEDLNVSKSAFSQQRIKINSFFFNCLNTILVESFYTHYQDDVKRWNELRLIAIDGSTSYLIDKKEVTAHFGTHGNQRGFATLSRILYAFDVLNKITIKADMYPISSSEQKIALSWLPVYEPDIAGAAFAKKSTYLLKAIQNIPADSLNKSLTISTKNTMIGLSRPQQLKKIKNYVFMVKAY